MRSHHLLKSTIFACNKVDQIENNRYPLQSTYKNLQGFLSKGWMGYRKHCCYHCISIPIAEFNMAALHKSGIQERLLYISNVFNDQLAYENDTQMRLVHWVEIIMFLANDLS